MRIRKTSQYLEGGATLSNEYGTSQTNGYTQEYVNGLNTYSTDEVRIGTWIDGKPLYRKVINDTIPNCTTDGTNVYKDVAHNISNMRRGSGTYIKNAFFISGGYNSTVLPFIGSTGSASVAFYGASSIRINNSITDLNGLSITIIIEYTKSTD